MFGTVVIASLLARPLTMPTVLGASLFKNGYAVVSRQVVVPAGGEVWVAPPGPAVLGTYWLGTEDKGAIAEARYTQVSETGTRFLQNLDEILASNIGKQIKIVADPRADPVESYEGELLSAAGQIVVLGLDQGERVVIQKSRIQSAVVYGDDLKVTAETKLLQDALYIKGTPGTKVLLYALQNGLTWVPSYRIELLDDKNLIVTAKATVMNDLVDLKDLELKLITGFPHISYLGSQDPMSVQLNATQIADMYIGAASANAPGPRRGEMMIQVLEAKDSNFAPMPANVLNGFQAEDLFFYRQRVSEIKVGDRGYYVLFQSKAPYKHLYTLDIRPTPVSGYNMRQETAPGDEEPMDIWHEIEFANTGKVPFTTGTAMLVQKGETLGEDSLKYVAAGGKASTRITKTLDVRASQVEEATDRIRGAIKNQGGSNLFDLVSVKGTIELTNHKVEAVEMRIARSLYGEVFENADGAEVVKTSAGLKAVNMTSQVTWRVTLKPGETRKITLGYKVFVNAL